LQNSPEEFEDDEAEEVEELKEEELVPLTTDLIGLD
jgi:hypothetical protein